MYIYYASILRNKAVPDGDGFAHSDLMARSY